MQKYKLSTYVIIVFFTLFSGVAVAVVDSYINTSMSPTDNICKLHERWRNTQKMDK